MPIEKEKNEGNANFEKQVQKIIKPKKKKNNQTYYNNTNITPTCFE